MSLIKLTTAQALVQYLAAQKIVVRDKGDSEVLPLFGCAFAIFGHGNVTCLGQQFYENQASIPVWRGQNEQSMAFAAVAYAKARKRLQIGIATSSIGPGATNMVTAAGVAHTNRLPLLLLAGDSFNSRLPDPVLQQTEHFNNPTITVNDTFKSVTRFWDRITSPEQLLQSLPHAVATLLDPADCGPVFISLPQDIQGAAAYFPEVFFEEKIHRLRRPQPEKMDIDAAAQLITNAKSPLIISGGGVHYSGASQELLNFSEKHRIPVVETIAGRASLLANYPLNCGPIGVTGSESAKALTEASDVVLAIGTRLQDFVTGSWTTFRNPCMKLISINTCRYDATKHFALSIIADAKDSVASLGRQLEGYKAKQDWQDFAFKQKTNWQKLVASRTTFSDTNLPSYAQIIGQVNKLTNDDDRVLTAAGGLPAELNMNWQSKSIGNIDIEFGFSCMGYEIAGGWGSKIALPENDVVVLVGDGSYLLLNSDIYSSVLSGHKIIVIVCDNGGFAVINKLQNNTGNDSFNNLFKDCSHKKYDGDIPRVDFVNHAKSMGAYSERVNKLDEFAMAFCRAREADRSTVLVVNTDPNQWSSVDTWWEVGLPEQSDRDETRKAVEEWEKGRLFQKKGA